MRTSNARMTIGEKTMSPLNEVVVKDFLSDFSAKTLENWKKITARRYEVYA